MKPARADGKHRSAKSTTSTASTPASAAAPGELRYSLREGHVLQVDDATSARMARIRQKATSPEQAVGKALRALGHHYRSRNRDLAGSPDFANRKARWAVFVHGCFWHRHGCSATTTPARNREFWEAKFARNQARDQRAVEALAALGFRVLVLWECEIKRARPEELVEKLRAAFAAA